MSDERNPDVTKLTDTQRRRAEALTLVHFLFPYTGPEVTHRIARWIIAGKTS